MKTADSLSGRKSEFSQIIEFESDSLILALYDNGEVDGDSVSIFLNGEQIISRKGLKTKAFRKTIYPAPGVHDVFSLVMYAENLGLYPPNTGLLVVYDGEQIYHIRFSADMKKNAGVLFRRKIEIAPDFFPLYFYIGF
ncbi:MAG: DUF3108 domain-containing protein [Chitinophagaceae bacterium]|nr:DUF3108 domain-containing protein [Chitinophagaceae bacterium]